jgi:hypothetical protein
MSAGLGDHLAAVGQTLKPHQRAFDQPRGEAKGARGGIGRAGVLVVVSPGQAVHVAQIDRGDLSPFRLSDSHPLRAVTSQPGPPQLRRPTRDQPPSPRPLRLVGR